MVQKFTKLVTLSFHLAGRLSSPPKGAASPGIAGLALLSVPARPISAFTKESANAGGRKEGREKKFYTANALGLLSLQTGQPDLKWRPKERIEDSFGTIFLRLVPPEKKFESGLRPDT